MLTNSRRLLIEKSVRHFKISQKSHKKYSIWTNCLNKIFILKTYFLAVEISPRKQTKWSGLCPLNPGLLTSSGSVGFFGSFSLRIFQCFQDSKKSHLAQFSISGLTRLRKWPDLEFQDPSYQPINIKKKET